MPAEPKVRDLQANLSRLGFSPGTLDGMIGKNTLMAMEGFRVRYELPNGFGRGVGAAEISAAAEAVAEAREDIKGVSADEFDKIYSRAPDAYRGPLNEALVEGLLTGARREMFLAQLGHESVGLKYMEEIASGEAYEGRRDLGNAYIGDGRKYKGRGPIQLTGRANYRRFGKLLGLDLEGEPELAASPEVGFRTAVMYWTDHGLNALADADDYRQITRRINGGYNGWDDRKNWLKGVRKFI